MSSVRALLLSLGMLCALASPANAATVLVTVSSDDNTGDPQPGQLRYAIQNAGAGDTVQIVAGVNPQLLPPGAVAGGGQIVIDKDLIIEGQGANQTSISVPGSGSRIFNIFSMASQIDVTIRDLRMSGGTAPSGMPGPTPGSNGSLGQSGGAILNSEQLTLDRVSFYLNSAGDGGPGAVGAGTTNPGGPGGAGGGGGSGGALLNTVGGVVNILNSTFEENAAGDGGGGGQGGPSDGSGMLDVAGNGGAGGVGQEGGAISNAGSLTVTNSTFYGNRSGRGGEGGDKGSFGGFGAGGDGGASGHGGAIHQASAGSLTLTNVTITGNTASIGGDPGASGIPQPGAGDPGADGSGGGTFVFSPGITPTIANSIYSANTATTAPHCAGGGPVTSVGANLAFPGDGGCPGSFLNGDPQLQPPSLNGAQTATLALGPGSAAIDAAGPAGQATDQRGVARPQGSRCDLGAFELQQATIPGTTCAGPPAAPPPPAVVATAPTASAAPSATAKKCKKGRKLKKGRCVKKRKKK